jgi:hypothetical protein
MVIFMLDEEKLEGQKNSCKLMDKDRKVYRDITVLVPRKEKVHFDIKRRITSVCKQNSIFLFQRVERRETVGERVRKRQMKCERFFYKENSQNIDIRLHNSNENYIKEEKVKQKNFPEVHYLPS